MFQRIFPCSIYLVVVVLLIGLGGGASRGFKLTGDQSQDKLFIPPALRDLRGSVPLSQAPVDLRSCTSIAPSQNSRLSFMFAPGTDSFSVYAPADGCIVKIKARKLTRSAKPDDFELYIAHTRDFISVVGRVSALEESIIESIGEFAESGDYSVSIPVKAGQEIGRCGAVGNGRFLEFAVMDTSPEVDTRDASSTNVRHSSLGHFAGSLQKIMCSRLSD